jgi:diadenosine tetraphosphate (Ap4A) HIT family hydrolase
VDEATAERGNPGVSRWDARRNELGNPDRRRRGAFRDYGRAMATHSNAACFLCGDLSAWTVRDGESWRIIVNRNQNLLGKLCVVLHRHEESVANLTAGEWAELQQEIRWAVERLSAAFHPDHFNHVFLQNQDRHVHLHVIPRYATARRFAGQRFRDPGYPLHYSLATEQIVDAVFATRLGQALDAT